MLLQSNLFWLIGVLFVWNSVLTFLFFKSLKHYRNLTNKVGKGNLEKVLETVLKQVQENQKGIRETDKVLVDLQNKAQGHFQKVGLVKFNPFSEVGGNHSFSLALLDSQASGLVITGLHSRESTRIYTKRLIKGKSEELGLSKEEELAVAQAQKKNSS